jgi:hypothetical protein
MRILGRWFLVSVLCSVAGPALSGDNDAVLSSTQQVERRWSVLFCGLGQLTDEPNVSLMNSFAAAGLDGHSGVFYLSRRRAQRIVPIFASSLEAGYAPRKSVELRLFASPAQALVGRVSAWSRSGETAVGTASYVQTIGAMMAYRRGFLRVGLGPAVTMTTLTIDIGMAAADIKATKLGAIFEAGVVLPERTRVFFEATVQYRYVGSVDIGPLSVREHGRDVAVVTASIPFDYTVVSLGVGLRF